MRKTLAAASTAGGGSASSSSLCDGASRWRRTGRRSASAGPRRRYPRRREASSLDPGATERLLPGALGCRPGVGEQRQGGLGSVGLGLAYGVLHAAGPGHGKAVISAYLFATGETVRRGIALSIASAFLQAVAADRPRGDARACVGRDGGDDGHGDAQPRTRLLWPHRGDRRGARLAQGPRISSTLRGGARASHSAACNHAAMPEPPGMGAPRSEPFSPSGYAPARGRSSSSSSRSPKEPSWPASPRPSPWPWERRRAWR